MSEPLPFRLIRLQIFSHPVLGEVDITLCDDEEFSQALYTTGIIGANGTGKSHLLSVIATVFSEIHDVKNSKKLNRQIPFSVTYSYWGDTYTVSNVVSGFRLKEDLIVTKNGVEIRPADILLPERVIASTMTVTDKFLAKTDDFYRYKGIRNEMLASTTGTRTIIRKTVDSLLDCISFKNAFQDELRQLLNVLGLEAHLEVSYRMRYKDYFLKQDMTVDGIRDFFEHWQQYFKSRKTPPWGYNNYMRNLHDNYKALEAAAIFLSDKAKGRRGNSSVATYDLMKAPWAFQRDALALKTLTQLDLVSFPSIHVAKKSSIYGLEDSSSGETHLLCQFIGIMADIRPGSLILIDEPENSSHPDWQMNYVGWLRDIFWGYKDCHFIIATHSPLILANMKAQESTIVRLIRDDNKGIRDEGGMAQGCYSWTVDEILKEVMEMKSNRTVDFNAAMTIFEEALKEDNKRKAMNAFEKLRGLIRPGNDLMELLRIQMIGLGCSTYDKD